jgi:hypothetical protein
MPITINPCYRPRQKITMLPISACYRLANKYLLLKILRLCVCVCVCVRVCVCIFFIVRTRKCVQNTNFSYVNIKSNMVITKIFMCLETKKCSQFPVYSTLINQYIRSNRSPYPSSIDKTQFRQRKNIKDLVYNLPYLRPQKKNSICMEATGS